MGGIPDTIIIAVIMAVPTLLVYFGSRKKQKVETESLISQNWEKLNNAQNAFTNQVEERVKLLGDKVTTQDVVIAQQNATIAQQNSTIADQNRTIAAQSDRISEQDRTIQEQKVIIDELTKQIEGMGGTPHGRSKSK